MATCENRALARLSGAHKAGRLSSAFEAQFPFDLEAAVAKAEAASDDWVMVHDAARPCIRSELVEQFIDELDGDSVGGLLALPLADTIKCDDGAENLRVAKTIPRDGIWRAQTPQMFRFGLLQMAMRDFVGATDEAQAIESIGHQPKIVMGDSGNLKVTYSTDMQLAKILLNMKTDANANTNPESAP